MKTRQAYCKKTKVKKIEPFDLKIRKICSIGYIVNSLSKVMTSGCECGICGHPTEEECIKKECKCCLNFHERSGSKRK